MKRRLLSEARRAGEGLLVKKDNRTHGSCSTAFQRFQRNYFPSLCEEKLLQDLGEKMGSLHSEVQELRAELSAMHNDASTNLPNTHKHLLQSSFKTKIASLQEEMKGLRTDMAASLCDTASIRADLDSHSAVLQTLISRLHAEMSKGHMDLCKMEVLKEEIKEQCADVMQGIVPFVNGKVAELKADMANTDHDNLLLKKVSFLHEQVTKLRDHMFKDVASLIDEQLAKKMADEMTGMRADVTKLVCHVEDDVAANVSMLHEKIDLLMGHTTRLSADMSKIRTMDQLDQYLSIKIDQNLRVMLEKFQKIDKILEGLQEQCQLPSPPTVPMPLVDDPGFNKQKDLLNKMHAQMEWLCGVVEPMNGVDASVVWSNVMAQEKGIVEMQEFINKLSSNVESYALDNKHANVILVKIVSVFLACTVAFYAWIVWSFDSCYPF